jgi:hypothetical protein
MAPRAKKRKKQINQKGDRNKQIPASQNVPKINYMRLLMGEYYISNYTRRVLLNASPTINTSQKVRHQNASLIPISTEIIRKKKEKEKGKTNGTTR